MTGIGLLVIFMSCLHACSSQGPVFTRPLPDGSTTVNLNEGSGTPIGTNVLLVQTVLPTLTLAISAVSVADNKDVTSDLNLVTNQIQTAKLLDFETTPAYTVTVTATDATGTTTAKFTLQVTDLKDEAPVFSTTSNTFSLNWDEEQGAGSTVFPAFNITDADAGDTHTYSLSGSQASYFTINPTTGAIQVNSRLDRDAAGAVTTFNQLTLTVTDAGGNTATTALSMTLNDINDNAPVCAPALYTTSVAENTAAATTVATLTCNDIDLSPGNGAIKSYAIASGDDTANKFSMSGSSVITTATPLNYETKTRYELVVNIVDDGATPQTGTATVVVLVTNVNEADPVWGVFTPAGPTYTVSESASLGTSIVTLTATDTDSGTAGQLEYELVSTTDSGGNAVTSTVFSVDAASGKVVTSALLDTDTGITSYTLVVGVKDKGSPVRSATSSLTVNLQDVNDNSPVFSATTYSATITEANARAGTWAGKQLTATDADRTTGTLLYQITGGNSLNKFKFNTATAGLLQLNAAIDVDKPTANPYNYVLTVEASDNGVPGTPARTGTATVTITISPVTNDQDPVFGTPTPSASPTVAENAAIGTTVATLPVTDNDVDNGVPQTITFAITGGNTDNDFSIDSVLGAVTTAKTLDYERTTAYSLIITATDNGSPARTSTFTLSVTVTNVNEHAPTCTSYNLVAKVNEAVASQPSQVATVSCTDSDTGDSVVYSVVPAVAGFSVNSASGVVSTLTALNYEAATSVTLTILAKDSLTPTLTSTVTLSVLVQPVNEFDPVFSPASYTRSLAEDVAAGTSVVTVTATDNDKGAQDGTIRYSIVSGNGAGSFNISSSTGEITTTAVGLDRETTPVYTLTVRASDSVPGAATEKTADVTVIVSVTDVNDNPPICTPVDYKASVTEPSVVGATVVTLTATDDDEASTPNSTPTFTVTAGDAASPANIFTTSGANLVLSKTVDYETTTSYNLTITVRDGGTPALSSTCKVAITIIAQDEFPPVFSVPNHSVTLSETTAVGTLVYNASATDADVGNGSTITYSIISGNTNNDFFCYSNTGVIVVWNTLDYDTPPRTYNLTVQARDDAGLTATLWLYIQLTDVNDQTPVFTQNVYSIAVNENIANNTQVLVVTAVDSDSGAAGTVTYTAVSGNGMSLFAVHPGTGAITTIATIDREVRRFYSLVVQAADGGTPSLSATTLVSITIRDYNDNAPVFTPDSFTVTVSEGAAVGTSVTTVTAADADSAASNNVFSYVLTDTHFGVGSSNGVVSTIQTLDRETKARHVLQILAPDSGAPALTGTATVTVLVEDVNDNTPIITGTYTPTVSENAALGTVVTTVTATDADEGDNARLTYVIASGNTGNDFVISSVSGVIQVNNALDRERTATYNLVVEVNDNGSPKLTATTTVTITISDVNDNPPVWSQSSYSFSVSENVAAGQPVGQVTATDADKGINAALTYSVVLFWAGNAAHFRLNGATGAITTAAVLDRETTSQYRAWLRATDAGSPQLHADVNVTIAVNDLNDNAPRFNQISHSASTTENQPVGTGVLTVTVTDDDIGVNAAVTLSIDTSTAAGARANQFFQVTSGTGVISVKKVIDRETDTAFTFTLLAVDGGSPAHTSSANVTITVADVNDNAPTFTQSYYNTEIAYSGLCTKSVVTVTATDADTGLNGNIVYYLQTATYDHLFQLDASSGELSLKSSITANGMYFLNASARDSGTPTLTAATPALIRVDGMIPNEVVITFKLGITTAAFQALQATFLQQLQVLMQQRYPTAVARLWCAETNSDGLADVHVYFLSDNSTEAEANSNVAKYYVSQANARSVFTDVPAGTPNSALSGSEWSPYNIQSVQAYAESQTPWERTAEGIAIITVCCLVGVVLLTVATYVAVKYCRHVSRRPKPQRIVVKERKAPARNNIQPREETPKQIKPRPMSDYDEDFFWNRSAPS